MMKVLESLKRAIEEKTLVCNIEDIDEEIYPEVRLTPVSEDWKIDNLGNPKSKEIVFSVTRYINQSDYPKNIQEGIAFIEEVYTDVSLQKEILNIKNCRINAFVVDEQMLVAVQGTFTVNLYRRLKNGNN